MLWKLPEIRLAPDVVIPLFADGSGITNTLICTWLTIIVLALVFYFGTRRRDLLPTGMQNLVEWMVELLLGLVEGVSGKEKGKKFFPLVATFFIFIFACNVLDVFPGVDTIGAVRTEDLAKIGNAGVYSFLGINFLFGQASNLLIPWIRPATTDLNLTVAMAIVSVVVTQIFGFYTLGPKEHLSKYFNFKALFGGGAAGVIQFIAGFIEIISEVARIISFSFRLFGNIFAGSALLAVFAFLLPFVSNIIFIPFELFVAFVQALVFALLTLVFMEIATTSHEHAAAEYDEHHQAHEQHEQAREQEAMATH
ncbi:MAG TPA: F0F1 ATP synthase subunit A [Ktedonosporobacter sp.]|nr:F0F1 ATP synthase subunit A [Ktedonosporobacter sp.]